MTVTDARLAYRDCYEVMQKALDDPKGARIEFPSKGEAINYRLRLNKARALDRRLNREAYPLDHHMSGQSEFDVLRMKVIQAEETFFVYLEHQGLHGKVEGLSEVADKPFQRRV